MVFQFTIHSAVSSNLLLFSLSALVISFFSSIGFLISSLLNFCVHPAFSKDHWASLWSGLWDPLGRLWSPLYLVLILSWSIVWKTFLCCLILPKSLCLFVCYVGCLCLPVMEKWPHTGDTLWGPTTHSHQVTCNGAVWSMGTLCGQTIVGSPAGRTWPWPGWLLGIEPMPFTLWSSNHWITSEFLTILLLRKKHGFFYRYYRYRYTQRYWVYMLKKSGAADSRGT